MWPKWFHEIINGEEAIENVETRGAMNCVVMEAYPPWTIQD